MLSIGLVGCGNWGRLILRDLVSLGTAVSVVAAAKYAALAEAAGASTVVTDIADLPRVDGIVVATPTHTHAGVVESLLPRRVPIFCEKPLCDDAKTARRLAAAAPDRLFVMDKWRYHCGVRELAAIAGSGELGPVMGIRTTRVQYSHSHADTDCIWTLLPHDLSIAADILGRLLTPRWAIAERSDRMLLGLQTLSSGADGLWHMAEIGVRAPGVRREIELRCRDGVAILQDSYSKHILIVANPVSDGAAMDPALERRAIAGDMPLLAELKAFVGHLSGGPPPRSSAAEGAAVVETIETIRRLAGL